MSKGMGGCCESGGVLEEPLIGVCEGVMRMTMSLPPIHDVTQVNSTGQLVSTLFLLLIGKYFL